MLQFLCRSRALGTTSNLATGRQPRQQFLPLIFLPLTTLCCRRIRADHHARLATELGWAYPLTRSRIEAVRCLVGVNSLSIDPIQSSARQSGGKMAGDDLHDLILLSKVKMCEPFAAYRGDGAL